MSSGERTPDSGDDPDNRSQSESVSRCVDVVVAAPDMDGAAGRTRGGFSNFEESSPGGGSTRSTG